MDSLGFFMNFMQRILHSIHRSLSTGLGLPSSPPGSRFEDHHRPSAPSPCMLRLLKYHAASSPDNNNNSGPPQTPHTDLGSLTVLFTSQPGLQVLLPSANSDEAQEWTFIDPRPGCAIINIGDGLAALSGGRLRSALHRVVPLPGRSMAERYSFAYLQRAESDTPMSPLLPLQSPRGNEEAGLEDEGNGSDEKDIELLTSEQWLRRKFMTLRGENRESDKITEWVLTGRKDSSSVVAA